MNGDLESSAAIYEQGSVPMLSCASLVLSDGLHI